MNPYPDTCSVLVLDNCRIHHNEALVELVHAAGCLILYLPAYSPDLNPIEESFSTRTLHCFPIIMATFSSPTFSEGISSPKWMHDSTRA
jgi:DDE superfamily endonuclease